MSRPIALVDLDDTLFQTQRKCPPDVPVDRLTALGFTRDGDPLSFATPRQMAFLRWLAETTRLIPVTARSLDALRRVDIRFTAAICAHGGVVLNADGAIDEAWAAKIAAAAARHADALKRLVEAVNDAARHIDPAVRARILCEGRTPLYVIAKHDSADADALAAVFDAAVPAPPPGWTLHRNGNNIALLPPHLGKAKALAHILPGLRDSAPDAPLIGIGDSLTDAPFMALCDFAMLPTRSQLADRLFA